MATLMSAASSAFTTSTTWGTVDATSYLNAETGSDVLTTAYSGTRSSAFTPGAITIDGLAVKLSVRTGTTGTMSVSLRNSTIGLDDFVTGTEVTINCADLPAAVTANADGGWIFFKFASSVLLLAANNYNIQAKTSSASQISLFRDGTTDNISRCLRTTTNASPGAGDDLIVIGEYTGAGTSNTLTVTMDNEATTDFGSNTTSLVTPALALGSKGVLTWGTTASKNYYLKLSGNFVQYLDSTYNMGTTGTPMPSTSTGVLEFDPAADGDMGYVIRGGTSNIQGASKTLKTTLTSDVSAAGTTLVIGSTTGWLVSDVLALASTTRTSTESETKIIQTVDSATGVTLTAGVTNAHSGTSPTIGEVINLTNNLKIRSATSTLMAYVLIAPTSTESPTIDWDYVEFYYLGENVAGKRGIEVGGALAASVVIQNCSLHDTEDWGFYSITSVGAVNFSNNVCYNLNSVVGAGIASILITATSGTPVFSGNYIIGCNAPATNTAIIQLNDAGTTFTNNVIAGCSTGVQMWAVVVQESSPLGTHSGNVIHSNSGVGLVFGNGVNANLMSGTLATYTIWRNASYGALHLGSNSQIIMTSLNSFGNVTANLTFQRGTGQFILYSPIFNSDATLAATASGLDIGVAGVFPNGEIYIYNGSFGATTAHTQDILATATTNGTAKIYLFNTVLASTTEVSSNSNLSFTSLIASHKNDTSSTTFKNWYRYGTIVNDTTTRHTASGYSWKMTPNTANASGFNYIKLILPGPSGMGTFKVAVNASSAVTITGYVQKDGSYNGNAPRLVVVGGIVDGVGSAGTDSTASLTVGASTWEQLSVSVTPNEAGVIEYYFDCDGTAGNVYVDDIAVSQV